MLARNQERVLQYLRERTAGDPTKEVCYRWLPDEMKAIVKPHDLRKLCQLGDLKFSDRNKRGVYYTVPA
jgi:hypothetical protein